MLISRSDAAPRGVLGCLVLAGLAWFGAPAPTQAQSVMSEEEMLATLPGAQVQAVGKNGKPWQQAYSAAGAGKRNGTLKGVWSGGKYSGKWQAKNGQWCEDTGDWQGCFQFVRKNSRTLVTYENGKPENEWTLK